MPKTILKTILTLIGAAASVAAFYYQLKAGKAAKRNDYAAAYEILLVAVMYQTGGSILDTLGRFLKRKGTL